jgi:23S rRNA (guanine2445-N2)-methyltransferase / 23S rRNA (guanine2069-N7)-methyltransferase
MEDVLDVQRDHPRLIRQCLDLLAPEGTLVFSTNLRTFRLEEETLGDCRVEDLSRATLPPDFSRNPRIHQCWVIQRSYR